jgi:RimJ/RimL family protein N-acetyltransferase
MRVYLETERLTLRQFTSADADDLVALDGDPVVMRFINGGQPIAAERVRQEQLPRLLAWHQRSDDYGYFAAIDRASGAFLGWFHFYPTSRAAPFEHEALPATIELGYRLRSAVWGQGYATEGARGLVRHGFTRLGVQRVIAHTLTENLASRRVLEKAGLRYERPFVYTGPHPTAWHVGRAAVAYGLNRADAGATADQPRQ